MAFMTIVEPAKDGPTNGAHSEYVQRGSLQGCQLQLRPIAGAIARYESLALFFVCSRGKMKETHVNPFCGSVLTAEL